MTTREEAYRHFRQKSKVLEYKGDEALWQNLIGRALQERMLLWQ